MPDGSPRLGQMAEIWHQLRWLLGPRVKWVALLPVLAVAAALADLVLMVGLVRAVLQLAEQADDGAMSLPGFPTGLSSGRLLSIAAAGGVAAVALRIAESIVVGRLTAAATREARAQVIDTQLRADWWTVSKQRAGWVQQLIGVNAVHAANVPGTFGTLLSTLTSLLIYGAFIVVSSPVAAVLFLVLGIAVSTGFSVLRQRIRHSARVAADQAGEVQLQATTLHGLARELRIFGVTEQARNDLSRTNRRSSASLATVRTMQRLLPLLFQQTILLVAVAAVAVASWADLGASAFGTAAILAIRSLSYLQQFTTAMQGFVEVRPYIEDLHQAVTETRAAAQDRGEVEISAVERVKLRDVAFSYGPTRVFDALSLEMKRGERVGIVGPSGEGKSTLLALLTGLVQPASGEVLVDGRPPTSYTASSWASAVALVGQEPVLLRGSIRDNIAFFRDATEVAIVDAARRAAILDTILLLPDGFDTPVGEGLSTLSGGQRQRIALARALLFRPSLVLLDEPTSALDPENAARIQDAVDQLEDRPLVVIVSHREELLDSCDRILHLAQGSLVEIERR